MGYSQVVRQKFLVLPYIGSIPITPIFCNKSCMTLSYKHFRLEYNHVEDSSWINIVQYYRKLLRANAVNLPSFVPFSSFSASSNFNKITFKSRYMAQLIGKFIYQVLRFQRILSHLLKIIKKISQYHQLKKSMIIKIYNKKNELLFSKTIKHILFFFKQKCRNKIKKQRYFLWKHFYQIPQSFWSTSKRKKIKSFIWRLFNYTGKYGKKNMKRKSRLFFLSYNRISRIIYKILRRKRFPKKKWFLLKKRNKKKKKITTKVVNKLWTKIYINNAKKKGPIDAYFNDTQLKFKTNDFYSMISYLNPNLKDILLNINTIHFASFFMNYCYFQYFRSMNKKNKWNQSYINFLNFFYYYLSILYKNKKKLNYIKTSVLKKTMNFSKLSHNSFFIRLNTWFNNFSVDRDLHLYFIINKLFSLIKFENISIIINDYTNKLLSFFTFYKKKINLKNEKISFFYTHFQKNYLINQRKFKNKKTKKAFNHIHYFKNIHKTKSWTRSCFYPRLINYYKKVQFNIKNHSSKKILKLKNIFKYRKQFFFTILKNQIKKQMLHSTLLKIKRITRDIKKVDLYKKNKTSKYYFFKTKHKKLKYVKIKDKIKFSNLSYSLSNQLKKKDQFLLNYFLYTFLKKKYKMKKRNFYKYNSFKKRDYKKKFYKKNKMKFNFLFNSKTFFHKKKQLNPSILYNHWKYYNLIINSFNFSLFNSFSKIKNKKKNNAILYKKKRVHKINKNNNKIMTSLNLLISNKSYDYYLKYERINYLIKLWENRKILKIIENNKRKKNEIELRLRFYSKMKLIHNFYSLNEIEKELFIEYYLRMHSYHIVDEYERNLSRVGPLSFYHTKTQNVGEIKNGIYLISNILFDSKFHYPKPFFTLTSYFTNVFMSSFFLPFRQHFKTININQFSYNDEKKKNYLYYKQWVFFK